MKGLQPCNCRKSSEKWRGIFESSSPDLEKYSSIYKDLHAHPELPGQELRAAATVAAYLTALGLSKIGGHGLVGINAQWHRQDHHATLRIGRTPPLKEKTGLPYASQVQQVDADGSTQNGSCMAADTTCTWQILLAAAELPAKHPTTHWSGTRICIFQPNEERDGHGSR